MCIYIYTHMCVYTYIVLARSPPRLRAFGFRVHSHSCCYWYACCLGTGSIPQQPYGAPALAGARMVRTLSEAGAGWAPPQLS